MARNHVKRLIATGLLALGCLTAVQTTATASAKVPCSTINVEPGQLPVVLVHGFGGNDETWGKLGVKNTLRGKLRSTPNLFLSEFEYEDDNFQWVTHRNIGPKLAERIHCLAAAARKAGNNKGVIVIGHSMGGLAAEYAISLTIDGRRVADDVGLLVTLGTPYSGSWVADYANSTLKGTLCNFAMVPVPGVQVPASENGLCSSSALIGLRRFSNRIQELPKLPSTLPTLAIASRTTFRTYVPTFDGEKQLNLDFNSDLVVSVDSASKGAFHTQRGGGSKIFHCYALLVDFKAPPCWHGNMPSYSPIQDAVTDGIKEYLAYEDAASLSFAGLTLPLQPSWKETERDEEAVGVEDTNCPDDKPCQFYIYAAGHTPCMATQPQPAIKCGEETLLTYLGAGKVGGRPAYRYQLKSVAGDDSWWFIPSKRMAINGNVARLDRALESASWS